MASATPSIMYYAAEFKEEAGVLEQEISPSFPLTQEKIIPKSLLLSTLLLTSHWPELGHIPTHRPGAGPTFFAVHGFF